MLALSPPLFSSAIGSWPLEEIISHSHQNNNYDYLLYKHKVAEPDEASSSQALLFHHHQFYSSDLAHQADVLGNCTSCPSSPNTNSDDVNRLKKLKHSASERNRRKKINALFSSLRSLLPLSDPMRKLSVPETLSRVLKYIPELKQQVEELTNKKEQILMRISKQQESQRKNNILNYNNSGFVVSTTRLNETEATIHISSFNNIIPLSQILLCLESHDLLLLNVSSSHTFADKVFYNFHFQVDRFQRLDSEILSEKLLSIMKNKEEGIITWSHEFLAN